jgi:Protein of unknown function (DUF3305)
LFDPACGPTWQGAHERYEYPDADRDRRRAPRDRAPLGAGALVGCRRDTGRARAGGLALELHRNETDAYRYNLSSERPQLFVVMRPTLDVNGLPLVPFQVTASPYEGLAYTEFGDDRVDPVPMPSSLVAWVQDFIDRYHVDQPFYKRRRGSHDQAAGETSEFVPVGEGPLSDE